MEVLYIPDALKRQKMMDDVGGFKAEVDEAVAKGLASGDGNFNTGWQSGSVAKDEKLHGDKGPAVQNWWYALNSYQYDVSGTSTTVDGTTVETVTVNIFKRYNWGNVAGGDPRDNVGPGKLIEQNDLAQLNADGLAQDYNVWGSYSYNVGG